MLQEMLQKKPKEKTLTIKVDQFTFIVSAYCHKKVGMTENMKFRLKCKEHPDYNHDFDDLKEMMDYINEFIYCYAIDLIV